MKNESTVRTLFAKFFPLILIVALLPVLVAYDSVMYWLTRPSCLNCGSLGSFLQNGSLSVMMVSTYVGEIGLGGYRFGKKKHG
jgi:hypothetical protein